MKYEEIPDFDKGKLNDLESNNPKDNISSILSIILNSSNYELSIQTIERFINHDNEHIKGIAIESIGHLARLWGKIPLELEKEVCKALSDKSAWVQDKAENAKDDIEIFLKRKINLK